MKVAPTPCRATCPRVPETFLNALGLPGAWAAQRAFALLDVAPPSWRNFLVTWQAWHSDPARPVMLHYVVVGPAPALPPNTLPPVSALAAQLEAALWGLLPGFHRLAFSDGQVLLTVCIGSDVRALLRAQAFEADAVFVNASPSTDLANVHTLKAVARCCRRDTRVAGDAPEANGLPARRLLAQCGFDVAHYPHAWCGHFKPHWRQPNEGLRRKPSTSPPLPPGWQGASCLVIGAGLAGTAVAGSLARRGWHVTVLDADSAPASGASSLPAGILAPHISPDDSPLSRLSRAGIRITLQQAALLLNLDQDWAPTGVLERCLDHPRRRPAAWQVGGADAGPAADWVTLASDDQRAACGLSPEDGAALWHARAGWIKPAELARAWLATPGITWRGSCDVASLQRMGGSWQAIDAAGGVLAQGDRVVLAAGYATAALARSHGPQTLPLQPIRGQVSWALHTGAAPGEPAKPDFPNFPVNGHGHLLAGVPLGAGSSRKAWMIGASYERDVATATLRPEDDAYNLARLRELLPSVAAQWHGDATMLQAWAGVRCATPTRLPWVGPLTPDDIGAGLWVCCGMGSRGLTFAALCAELLAAQWHGEPWPVDHRLGAAMTP